MVDPTVGGLSVVTCSAFPAGIPDDIALHADDHREARGDEVDGLIFEQAPGREMWFQAWSAFRAALDENSAPTR
jgi:hypothetical protein